MAAFLGFVLAIIMIYLTIGLLSSINDGMPKHCIITWGFLLYIWSNEGKRKRSVRDYLNKRYDI